MTSRTITLTLRLTYAVENADAMLFAADELDGHMGEPEKDLRAAGMRLLEARIRDELLDVEGARVSDFRFGAE